MSKPTRIASRIISFLPVLLVIILGLPVVGMAYIETTKVMGLRAMPVEVIGTGSMYPSLFWEKSEGGPEDENTSVIEEYRTTPHLYRLYTGFKIFGHTILHKSVGFGDIVSFKNAATAQILQDNNKDTSAGFIKRVIGLPGDRLELRDGFVYRNGVLIEEPYISVPRSTYGGTGLKDCQVITIPSGKYFVLGDNRKVSSDSRFELGLVSQDDIEFYLPYTEQKIYQSLWRDTSKDSQLLGQPTLNTGEFVTLVNKIRQTKQVKNLNLKPSLVKSSQLRGEKLLLDDKTSFGMPQAIAKSGYSNIVLGEFVSYGHFTAQELLENLLYNVSTEKQITSNEFSDLGLAEVSREIDGCPTRIIVGHLGGYVPAEYDTATINSWISLRDNLISVLPSWEKAIDYNNLDQAKLQSLITILRSRLKLAQEVVGLMQHKEWLSQSVQDRIKADKLDSDTAEALSIELNKP
ncbi:MAG: signal peptidase I [bacterium]